MVRSSVTTAAEAASDAAARASGWIANARRHKDPTGSTAAVDRRQALIFAAHAAAQTSAAVEVIVEAAREAEKHLEAIRDAHHASLAASINGVACCQFCNRLHPCPDYEAAEAALLALRGEPKEPDA